MIRGLIPISDRTPICPRSAWPCRGIIRGQTLIGIAGFWLIASVVLACKVPVFRYALERWPVDHYRLVAIFPDANQTEVKPLLKRLDEMKQSPANVDLEIIDLATLSEAEQWQLEDFDGAAERPRLQVFYPTKEGQRRKCWEGDLSIDQLSKWTNSPMRSRIASELCAGESAIFLLVEGDDPKRNDELANQLNDSLSKGAEAIAIPEGVIPRDRASEMLRDNPEASMDDVLRSDIPLRVSFQLRRLSRQNEEEAALLAMIGGITGDTDDPMVVPIFGRGRMLDAIDADDCDQETMHNLCRYIVGECSCTVKALNPGVDLILAVDWADRLGKSVVLVDPPASQSPSLVDIPDGHSPEVNEASTALVADAPNRWLPAAIIVGLTGLIAVGVTIKRLAASR